MLYDRLFPRDREEGVDVVNAQQSQQQGIAKFQVP
jgi:hypothetical protein